MAENLINRTGLSSGETIVILGAYGGLGSAAIQRVKIREAKVIGISSAGKEQVLREVGVDHGIDRNEPNRETAIKDLASNEVDVAADVVGGEASAVLISCLRPGGRYSVSGCTSGPIV